MLFWHTRTDCLCVLSNLPQIISPYKISSACLTILMSQLTEDFNSSFTEKCKCSLHVKTRTHSLWHILSISSWNQITLSSSNKKTSVLIDYGANNLFPKLAEYRQNDKHGSNLTIYLFK